MKLTPNWNQFHAHSWEKGVSISTRCRCVNKINILWEAQVSSNFYWYIISTVYSERTKKLVITLKVARLWVLFWGMQLIFGFFFCQQRFWVYRLCSVIDNSRSNPSFKYILLWTHLQLKTEMNSPNNEKKTQKSLHINFQIKTEEIEMVSWDQW